SLDNIGDVKAAGFDFIEVGVQPVLQGQLADAEWVKTAPDPAKLPLPIEAANGLVPASLPIVGPERNLHALRQYLERVTRRAKQVGITRLVFGSGGARKRPEGVDAATAAEHIAEFADMATDMCGDQGIILVIEHLNAGETNTLNKLHEAKELCDRIGKSALMVLVDSYH